MDLIDLKDRVYIVTGASSGIGRSCCEQIIRSGGRVIGIDVSEGTIVDDLYEHHMFSVLDEDKVSECVDDVEGRYGKIDGLVNAAGIWGNSKPFHELDTADFMRILSVNTTGTFITSKYVSWKMIHAGRGKIVNISCIRASIMRTNMSDYAASKGAVSSMTAAMALDLAPYNIQVNSIAPGFTYTGMTAASFDRPEVREQSEKLIPLGRLGMPEDISSVALFLLSDLSDYVTGSNMFADGGYHMQK